MDKIREQAVRLAAEIFGVLETHITEAPKWCGDGYDGNCLAGDCQIVGAIDLIVVALERAHREERERAVEAIRNELVKSPTVVNADEFCHRIAAKIKEGR